MVPPELGQQDPGAYLQHFRCIHEAGLPPFLLAYTAGSVGGNGCIPPNHLMEDAATAEIARIQLWQWVKAGVRTRNTGGIISKQYVSKLIDRVAKDLGSRKSAWKTEDVPPAVHYLKGQVGRERLSEILTSDLMDELARRDGVDVKWLKSAL